MLKINRAAAEQNAEVYSSIAMTTSLQIIGKAAGVFPASRIDTVNASAEFTRVVFTMTEYDSKHTVNVGAL